MRWQEIEQRRRSRLLNQGVDPDHSCRTNAAWVESEGSPISGSASYGPCLTCGKGPWCEAWCT